MTYRVETILSGLTGAPYLNVLNFSSAGGTGAQAAANAAATFWQSLTSILRNGLTAAVQPTVVRFNPVNGANEAFESVEPGSAIMLANGEVLPFAAQGLVRLGTGGVVHNRQVRGRIFIPGLTQDSLDNGVLLASTKTTIDNAVEAMMADLNSTLVVWSRPVKVATPKTPIRDGSEHIVTGSSLGTQFAVLRGRRD